MERRITRRRIRRGIIGIVLASAMVVGMCPEAAVRAEGETEAEVSEAVQACYEAFDGYWAADETFWNAWENYYGNEEISKEGALMRYQEVQDADENTIYSLYEEAASAHDAIIAAYETATEKYNGAVEKYNALSEEEKTSMEGYEDVVTCYENIETDYANLETPDKPGLTIYWKADGIYWEAVESYWTAMDQYYGNEENGTEGALEKYNKALESGESITTIMKLYQEASEARNVVLAAYETVTEKYNAVVEKYNALSADEKTSVEDYTDVVNCYADVQSGYDDLDTPQALTISSEAQITGTVSVASLNTDIAELLDCVGLTEEEKAAVCQGEQTKVILSVDSAKPTEKEKKLIGAKLGEYAIGQYLNLGLQLKIGNHSRNITEMTKPVSITITVPDNLVNKDTAKERTYRILRLHNGTVDVMDAVYDAASNKLTFETDRFSVYTLIYKDTVVSNSTGTQQPMVQPDSNTPATATPVTAPKTGDESPVMESMILLLATAAILLVYAKKRKELFTFFLK